MQCISCNCANVGCWSLYYVKIVFICACTVFQMNGMNWYEFLACLLVCACVNRSKSATLAQASQARLSEIRRELGLFLLVRLARAEGFRLGRQTISLRRVCLA